MLSVLRRGLHVGLNRPRIFALAGGALLAEILLRAALAALHPVLSVLCPPVVALPVLGAAAPTVRAAVADPETTPDWSFATTLRDCGPRLCVLAVCGHLVALALGAAAFLLVDTAVRAVIYATGGSVPLAAVVLTPLAGVATGALLAWGPMAPAVEHAVAGKRLRDVALAPVRAFGDRRRTAFALCLHGACVFVAAGVFGVCLVLASGRTGPQAAVLFAFLVAVLVTVGTLALLGVFAYPIHVALAAARAGEMRAVPVRRAAVAVLLVAGSVVGASAVRVSDAHPSPASPSTAPLPADATDAYAAALDHTAEKDHRVVTNEVVDGERVVVTTVVKHSTRQYVNAHRSDDHASVGYADDGVSYNFGSPYTGILHTLGERRVGNSVVRAFPYYWYVREQYSITGGIGYALPEARTGTWTTVAEENGTRTLELTGGAAVFNALYDVPAENGSYEAAVIRMRVDTDRGVVVGGRTRLNATVDDYRVVRNQSYVVESGGDVDVRRPDVLGPRSLGEWTWDLFAY